MRSNTELQCQSRAARATLGADAYDARAKSVTARTRGRNTEKNILCPLHASYPGFRLPVRGPGGLSTEEHSRTYRVSTRGRGQ